MIGDLREQPRPFLRSPSGWCCVGSSALALFVAGAGWRALNTKVQPVVASLPLRSGQSVSAPFKPDAGGDYGFGLKLDHTGTNWGKTADERDRLPAELRLNWMINQGTQTVAAGHSPTNWTQAGGPGALLPLGRGVRLTAGRDYTLSAVVEQFPASFETLRPELVLSLRGSEQISRALGGWVSLFAAFFLAGLALVCGLSFRKYRC